MAMSDCPRRAMTEEPATPAGVRPQAAKRLHADAVANVSGGRAARVGR